MARKPNIFLAWVAKHPILSSVFIFTTIIISFLLVLFLIQDPLLRDRNLKGVVSAIYPPDYELLVKKGKNQVFAFQDLDDGDALKHNQKIARNKNFKYVLFTGLAANAMAVYTFDEKACVFNVFWINAGFDSQLHSTLRQVLGKGARVQEQIVFSDYYWDRTWGSRFFEPSAVFVSNGAKAHMLKADELYWNKFGLPDKLQVTGSGTKQFKGLEIEIIEAGAGRTAETLMVYFPAERILYMGSMLQPYEIPRIDFDLGGRLIGLRDKVKAFTEDPRFQNAAILVPGRGAAFANDNLTHYLNFLNKLITRIEKAIAGNTGMGPAEIAGTIDWEREFGAFPVVEDRTADLVRSVIFEKTNL